MNTQNFGFSFKYCFVGLVFIAALIKQESIFEYFSKMSSLKVELIPNSPVSQVAKSPFWTKDSLFYIDILAGKINRYDYTANKFYTAEISEFFL